MGYNDIFSRGVSKIDENGILIIQSAPSRYIVWTLVFILGLPLTRYLWKKGLGGNFAPGFFFALFTIPLIALPGLLHEEILCDGSSVEVATGFWFDPNVYEVRLPVDGVVTGFNTLRTSEGNRLVLNYSTGDSVAIAMPELMAGNIDTLVSYLKTDSR